MQKSVTKVPKGATRALNAVYMKYLNAGGITYEVYTKQIESVVSTCDFLLFWHLGYSYISESAECFDKACRYYLGVSKMRQTYQQELIWVGCL